MALNERKHTVPAGTETPSRAALLAAFESVNDIVPVANITERDVVVAAIAPTASRPLFVYRADAPVGQKIEVTEDGTTWWTVPFAPSPAALIQGVGTQPVGAGGSPSIVALDTVVRAVGMTAGAGRITVSRPGVYLVSGMAAFSANGTGRRLAQVYLNGVGVQPTLHTSTPGASTWRVPTATYPLELAAGDYIQLAGLQESGAILDFVRVDCFLQATYLGAA